MSRVTLINPDTLAPPVGFSHVAIAGDWVWLGGQISTDETGRVLHGGDIVGQFRRALRNLAEALTAAGCRTDNIVKLTYYVTDLASYRANLGAVGAAYRDVMGRRYPASSLFEVRGLFEPDAMVEIECVAIREVDSGPRVNAT